MFSSQYGAEVAPTLTACIEVDDIFNEVETFANRVLVTRGTDDDVKDTALTPNSADSRTTIFIVKGMN